MVSPRPTVARIASVAVLVASTAVTAVRSQDSTATLAIGKTMSGRIAAGQSATFRISAAAGDLVQVAVDGAAQVSIEVQSPTGTMVAEIKRFEFLYASERMRWIAGQPGDYLVRLVGRDESAPSHPAVRLEILRPALPDDEVRTRADRAREAGEKLRLAESAAASRDALARFEQALALSQSVADRPGEAEAWLGIGLTWQRLSENTRSTEALTAALAAGRDAGSWPGEARALNGLGQIARIFGDMTRALDYYAQAIEVARRSGDRWTEVGAQNSTARIHSDTGDPQSALAAHARAIALSRASGDRGGEAFALNNIGNIHQTLGDLPEALTAYAEALRLRQAIGNELGVSSTISNIGRVYLAQREPAKALPQFERALEMTRRIGRRDNEGRNLGLLGRTHQMLGDAARAVDDLTESIALCGAVGDTFCEAEGLADLAAAESELARPDRAREHVARATTLMRGLGDIAGEARSRIVKARIEAAHGSLADARFETEQMLTLVEGLRARLASPALRASYLAASREAYELYVDLLMRLDAVEPTAGHAAVALNVSERARARSLLELLAETNGDIREGVDPVLLEREHAVKRQINGSAARRAILLTQKNARSELESVDREIDDLIARYREVEAEIRVRSPRFAALTQPVPLTLAEIQQQVIDDDTVLLEYAVAAEHSYLWAVTRTSVATYRLPGREVIEAAARRTYELMQSSHRPGQRMPARAAALELSRLVLGPAAGALAGKRLVIVPDGALQFVPFAALPHPVSGRGDEPLIAQHEIIVLPSASVVPALRASERRQPADRTLAVFADPVLQSSDARVAVHPRRSTSETVADVPAAGLTRALDESGAKGFERLRFTREEAREIASLAGKPHLMALDFDASRAMALEPDLSRYRYVHFATHALLSTRHPELSGIVLSLVDRNGKPLDGFLRLHDIYNLRLGADLVVLSGCQTALGRDVRGEGLIGLTRGFMYAGAPRVVASLWDVRDEQTSELMKRFYRGLLRDHARPAAALRAAQLSMLEDPVWSAPVYWAGFILQGEWKYNATVSRPFFQIHPVIRSHQ